jgi:TM2 domain-containing membrane protein YozV
MKAASYTGLLFLSVGMLFIAANATDSAALQIGNLEPEDGAAWKADRVKLYNPIGSGLLSALLPGAGQVYTGHYVKAVFHPALEAIFVSMAIFWDETAQLYNSNARSYRAWEAADTSDYGKMGYRELSLLSSHTALTARFSQYDFSAWAVGAHVFNILDALQASNRFVNAGERNPRTAALLAAIPGLGLGQLYNGSLSKAGMVMMTQVSLGFMAYNSNRLMDRAALNYARLTDPKADSLTLLLKGQYSDDWYGHLRRSFTNRNMYLWYSIFFYFYSMFDSVVDAYLHDYPEKMKIAPDLIIGKDSFSFSLTTCVRLPKATQ